MIRYTIVINYDSLDAYNAHGSQMETFVKAAFEQKGATEHTLFISTRSLPPIHTTSFVAPDTVTLDELKTVRRVFPEGVNVEIHQEA
ncbi:hypothetical protein P168DRAFT_317222 [Aspergillus campestris IBT 28561]|uniref:Uncharacterized protein n=1 Tax=Aspergillus campestris (strain IBT 28561) TaxID=1392248 RepID=A0A2I1D764_ASPC2|nr:uncharacterized protein P168DRAFT_317222 [Aspergillus campestris IBT 28561]PKY05699.1 hypothetical protein P168DRAFT_317222 [Aspergillus campestris IBT 28561]